MNMIARLAFISNRAKGQAYREGHRDARHDAAEIAAQADAEIAALRAENERLREALDPNLTKGAYSCEVTDDITVRDYDEETGEPYDRIYAHTISWTAIKAVLAMIRARAALQEGGGDA
jgi:hypothetical protein